MIPVVYNSMMTMADSPEPSLRKPRVIKDLAFTMFSEPKYELHVLESNVGGTLDSLISLKVHDKKYVHSVYNGISPNGFGSTETRVAVQGALACKGMLKAVDLVTQGRRCVLVPVSGFHHAGFDSNHGFCTFNGLAYATLAFLRQGNKNVMILDGDAHYGDGTADILARQPQSVQDRVFHYSSRDARKDLEQPWWAKELTVETLTRHNIGLVLYQAGADAYKEDPFGAGYLDKSQYSVRDLVVFGTAYAAHVPIVWNLAGGYSPDPMLHTLHGSTLMTCAEIYGRGEK